MKTNRPVEKKTIKLIERSNLNNTHRSIVDDNIKEISVWRKDSHKYKKLVFYYIISLGIFFIIILFNPELFINIACSPCEIYDAEYFVIIDAENKKFVHKVNYENFYISNKEIDKLIDKTISKENIDNPYVGSEYSNKSDKTVCINFKRNKYIYIESTNTFTPVLLELNKLTNKQVHEKMGLKKSSDKKGISTIYDYNYLLNKFGRNVINMENKSFIVIILQQAFHPFYFSQIYSLVVWYITGYIFVYIITVCSLVILLINSLHQYRNFLRILRFNNSTIANVYREFIPSNKTKEILNNNDSNSIVPGDIIKISNGDIIPADCIILDGYCTINEADLTGESTLVMKTPLPFDHREFNYDTSNSSFLFQGTKLNKCESITDPDSNIIHALVINTGYNTNRGNLIQNLLFPKPSNYNFYSNMKLFFVLMGICWIISIALWIYIFFKNNNKVSYLFKSIFDGLTIIIPPHLPITLTFTGFYFHWVLSKKNISCINDKKMNTSGLINTVVLDKTGTLTEDIIEICGFQTTFSSKLITNITGGDRFDVFFDNIENDTKIMNRVHKNFWKKYCQNPNCFKNYQINPQNNIIYFIECLATCHQIDKFKNDSLGNTIDKKMFESVNWIMEKLDGSLDPYDSHNFKYSIKCKNSYKITEDLIFKNQLTTENQHLFGRKFQLIVIKRFEFHSKYQSMSVIVKNSLDNSYRFFIKGAPEKIGQMCNKSYLPFDFEEKHMEHTKNGYRVLACATKVLPEREDYNVEENRKKFENNLIFLGFIICHNKLKRDTKHVICSLNNSNCKLIMATGDNPFTSISVAREAELIKDSPVFILDLEKDLEENFERLKM